MIKNLIFDFGKVLVDYDFDAFFRKYHQDTIETERLLLRRWKLTDAEALYKYACDPEVGPHAGWPPHKNVEESKMIIREVFTNDFTWAVVLKETNEPIGCMGYYPFGKSNIEIGENDAEVGYWIGKPHWNNGYCTEALQAMIRYCYKKKHFRHYGQISSLTIPHLAESWRNAVLQIQAKKTIAQTSIMVKTDLFT